MRAVYGHADGRRSCFPDTTLKNHVPDWLNGSTPRARTGLCPFVGMRTFGTFPGNDMRVQVRGRHDPESCELRVAAVVLGKFVR